MSCSLAAPGEGPRVKKCQVELWRAECMALSPASKLGYESGFHTSNAPLGLQQMMFLTSSRASPVSWPPWFCP